MTNTYLLEVIKALNPSKRQEMSLFLASDLYNRGKNAQQIVRLYNIILETAPEFSEEFLIKDEVYFKVFCESNIIPGRLEKVVSDLNKLLRIYALTQMYLAENNEEQQQLDWARWLRIQGLAGHSQKILLKLKSRKERDNIESLDLYRLNMILAEEQHEWESEHNQARGDLNIPKLVAQLDLFFHTYRTELLNRYYLQQKAAQLPRVDEMEMLSVSIQSESVILGITKCIHEILSKDLPSVDEIKTLMNLLESNEENLSFQTLSQFYAYLRSACNIILNGGQLQIVPILHEVNKNNLKKGYFIINKAISPNVYLNIVQVAIRAKDYDWAKDFTEEYKPRILGGDHDKFFYLFNMSQCLFAEGKFEESLEFIPEVSSNSHYHHMVRRLELKIYYELNSDLLLYKLDAFRKFIMRTATKTISANLRTMDMNFLNILMQIIQTPKKDKARSARLVARIEAKKLLADRAWLLEKARELG